MVRKQLAIVHAELQRLIDEKGTVWLVFVHVSQAEVDTVLAPFLDDEVEPPAFYRNRAWLYKISGK